jgi:hypothetical protein
MGQMMIDDIIVPSFRTAWNHALRKASGCLSSLVDELWIVPEEKWSEKMN